MKKTLLILAAAMVLLASVAPQPARAAGNPTCPLTKCP